MQYADKLTNLCSDTVLCFGVPAWLRVSATLLVLSLKIVYCTVAHSGVIWEHQPSCKHVVATTGLPVGWLP